MRKVILLRHGKSSWQNAGLDDHDRPLNPRGRAAAPAIGEWLVHRRHVPDTVLCSSSLRTQQTVEGLCRAMPDLPQPVIEEELYHASPDAMRDRLRRLPATCRTVLLVGHQPGIGTLTRLLADGTETRRCQRAYEHFPTAAAAVLELALDDWRGLKYEATRFIDFAKPRELMDA